MGDDASVAPFLCLKIPRSAFRLTLRRPMNARLDPTTIRNICLIVTGQGYLRDTAPVDRSASRRAVPRR
jgi:hypothetical protein